MKRAYREIDPTLTNADIARIAHILERMPIANKELSWLEALAPMSNGKLLAKILYKLEELDLKLMCRVSKVVKEVCKRYQLHERFYTSKAYMFGEGRAGVLGDGDTNPHTVGVPTMVRNLPPVKTVSCGYEHTGFVTTSGDAYLCGVGRLGRLGNGRTNFHYQPTPRRLENIPKVSLIACGDVHTMILTHDGDVYTFGSADFGMLGDGDIAFHTQPVPYKVPNLPKAKMIDCDFAHSAVVSVDGQLLICGSGLYGRLGDGDVAPHDVGYFKRVEGIPPVKKISCGPLHTGIVTIDGDVYMFGSGKFGVLGDGDVTNHDVGVPQKVQGLPKMEMISCGTYASGLLTTEGTTYVFGKETSGIAKKIAYLPRAKALSWARDQAIVISETNTAYISGRRHPEDFNASSTFSKIENIPPVESVSCGDAHAGLVTTPESSLNLTIDCRYCGKEAVYHDHAMAFCSKECQKLQYNL